MNTNTDRPQVGAPDPELKTSPIFDDADRDSMSLDAELEAGVCYFNDRSYRLGDFVCSGNELLRGVRSLDTGRRLSGIDGCPVPWVVSRLRQAGGGVG